MQSSTVGRLKKSEKSAEGEKGEKAHAWYAGAVGGGEEC